MIIEHFTQLSIISQIIALTLLFTLLVQLFYYLWFYSRIIFTKLSKDINANNLPPVSVVISAKNEQYNLPEYLPSILEQDYPDFQVVVVDDCSEDETWDILEQLKKKYTNLYTTRIHFDPIFKHGKKMALSLGIKAAQNDILVFTDADCMPAGKDWLRRVVSNYNDNTEVVIGYSPVLKDKGFINRMIRYDNVFTGIQYLGSALAKKPYMGVGRNLSYKKSLFFSQKGFSPYIQLMSGDDDLFINKVATKTNCAVEISPDAHVLTKAKNSWKDWIIQKRRHLTTGRYYRFGDKWRLGVEIGSRFLFYVTFIMALILIPYTWIVIAVFGLRFLVQGLIINLSAKKLKQPHLLFTFWLFDIVMPLLNAWLSFKNMRNPKGIKWK
ncbi:glycosyltransferase [Saccharicrinis sp. FJH2]|uniref:glycosyltransferase n=1 Tax=unclassified Saccharicrinis TaxID=2646859 RepID=UPI0035D4B7E6